MLTLYYCRSVSLYSKSLSLYLKKKKKQHSFLLSLLFRNTAKIFQSLKSMFELLQGSF